MSFDVTPCADLGEFQDAFFAIGQYFGAPLTEERSARFVQNLERAYAQMLSNAGQGAPRAFDLR